MLVAPLLYVVAAVLALVLVFKVAHTFLLYCCSETTVQVNCWFCNVDSYVPPLETSAWTCPHCEQYNGFAPDGSYNCVLVEQSDVRQNVNPCVFAAQTHNRCHSSSGDQVLCDECAEKQELLVRAAAQGPEQTEDEDVYRARIEQESALCDGCAEAVRARLQGVDSLVRQRQLRDRSRAVLASSSNNHLGPGPSPSPVASRYLFSLLPRSARTLRTGVVAAVTGYHLVALLWLLLRALVMWWLVAHWCALEQETSADLHSVSAMPGKASSVSPGPAASCAIVPPRDPSVPFYQCDWRADQAKGLHHSDSSNARRPEVRDSWKQRWQTATGSGLVCSAMSSVGVGVNANVGRRVTALLNSSSTSALVLAHVQAWLWRLCVLTQTTWEAGSVLCWGLILELLLYATSYFSSSTSLSPHPPQSSGWTWPVSSDSWGQAEGVVRAVQDVVSLLNTDVSVFWFACTAVCLACTAVQWRMVSPLPRWLLTSVLYENDASLYIYRERSHAPVVDVSLLACWLAVMTQYLRCTYALRKLAAARLLWLPPVFQQASTATTAPAAVRDSRPRRPVAPVQFCDTTPVHTHAQPGAVLEQRTVTADQRQLEEMARIEAHARTGADTDTGSDTEDDVQGDAGGHADELADLLGGGAAVALSRKERPAQLHNCDYGFGEQATLNSPAPMSPWGSPASPVAADCSGQASSAHDVLRSVLPFHTDTRSLRAQQHHRTGQQGVMHRTDGTGLRQDGGADIGGDILADLPRSLRRGFLQGEEEETSTSRAGHVAPHYYGSPSMTALKGRVAGMTLDDDDDSGGGGPGDYARPPSPTGHAARTTQSHRTQSVLLQYVWPSLPVQTLHARAVRTPTSMPVRSSNAVVALVVAFLLRVLLVSWATALVYCFVLVGCMLRAFRVIQGEVVAGLQQTRAGAWPDGVYAGSGMNAPVSAWAQELWGSGHLWSSPAALLGVSVWLLYRFVMSTLHIDDTVTEYVLEYVDFVLTSLFSQHGIEALLVLCTCVYVLFRSPPTAAARDVDH